MRRVLGLDWRIASILAVILLLAFGAVFQSRGIYGKNSDLIELSEKERDCVSAKKANGGKTTKECKSLIELTAEDPVALYTFVLTVATALLFVATAGLWRMAWRQSKDTKEAIAASRDANEIARQSFEIGQRPWLGFEHRGPSAIRLQHNRLSFTIPIVVQNHGNGPAVAVHFGCVLLQIESGTNYVNLIRRLAESTMREVTNSPLNPETIFPDQALPLERIVSLEFDRSEIDARQKTLFSDYFILIAYRHPVTGKTYCTATGYSSMREAFPTYSLEGLNFDISAWPIHVMPGCNFVV